MMVIFIRKYDNYTKNWIGWDKLVQRSELKWKFWNEVGWREEIDLPQKFNELNLYVLCNSYWHIFNINESALGISPTPFLVGSTWHDDNWYGIRVDLTKTKISLINSMYYGLEKQDSKLKIYYR